MAKREPNVAALGALEPRASKSFGYICHLFPVCICSSSMLVPAVMAAPG